ncbi:MAG: pilus assembly protein PilP [Alteromonadaceae bacterium]|nr:pilus assembly protein PilP [Alteromonadaceae bacterium]
MSWRTLFFSGLLLLQGCGKDTSDLQAYIEEVKATTSIPVEPYPEFSEIPVFKYDAKPLRSPFENPNQDTLLVEEEETTASCAKPDIKRQRSALETYGIDALSIQGFFTSVGKKWAIIVSNDGALHRVTVGDYLGLFFGKITEISKDTVFFTEQLPDGTGCWIPKQSTLSINSAMGEKSNV